MDAVIKVEDLSKKFIIRHQNVGKHDALRDVIAYKSKELFTSAGKVIKRQPVSVPRKEEFWALKDLNFEVVRGDRLGIIGRNGAGKSTLLKILSRITEPTKGKISISGRVSSLLEVGTGFHPELSGRENIFLNGAILGMKREEIKRKFDEIVDFSGVEKFLDTPVKRYSSGMYVRLAFAVAAHLETEILVVDEVLAVGDSEFQKKCLGKMDNIGKDGRTVIFVSHNLAAIEQLCNSCMLIDKGQISTKSIDVKRVIKNYVSNTVSNAISAEWINMSGQFKNEWFIPLRFAVCDSSGITISSPIRNDEQSYLVIEGNIEKMNSKLTIGYYLFNQDEVLIYHSAIHDVPEEQRIKFKLGLNIIRTQIPNRLLNENYYRIELVVFIHGHSFICQQAINAPSVYFSIEGGLSDSNNWRLKRPGILAPVLNWEQINSGRSYTI